jgi:hypothetical protein
MTSNYSNIYIFFLNRWSVKKKEYIVISLKKMSQDIIIQVSFVGEPASDYIAAYSCIQVWLKSPSPSTPNQREWPIFSIRRAIRPPTWIKLPSATGENEK